MAISDIIKQKLSSALNPINIEVIDESYQHAGHAGAREGGETHFAVTVVSREFDGMPKVNRHKLVYKILEEELKGRVHALRINAISAKES